MSTENTGGASGGNTAGTGGAAGAGGGNEPAAGDWTASLSPDLKGYVQTKGFKDTTAVLESYRNFEKMQGVPQDRLLKLPESMDSDEGRAILQRLGLPKEAKEYGLKPLQGKEADQPMYDKLSESFHKAGLTRTMAEKLMNDMISQRDTEMKTRADQGAIDQKNANDSLVKEWGAAYEQNKQIANQAATTLGLTQEQATALGQAMGPAAAMKLLHKLGTATGEHNFVGGNGGGNGIMTPQAAQSKITELISDKGFYQRLVARDVDAVKQWDGLHKMAAGGAQ